MLRSLSKYLHPKLGRSACYNYASLRFLSSKEVVPSTGIDSHDFLIQNLRSSTNTTDVLKIIGNHYNIMNGKHMIQSLKSLFELKKSGHCQFTDEELTTNADFIELCKRLKSQSRVLSLNDTVEALKVLSYIGVPSNSIIIQVLLQLIRQSVNDLSLHQIIFLEFVMRKFYSSPLVDALKIALPLVFETQLSLKMNREDASHLASLFSYACKKPLPDSSVKLIANCLQKVENDIDLTIAKSIIQSFSDMRKPWPSYQALLNKSWDVLAQDIDKCSYKEVEDLLHRMKKKYTWKQTYFYHEDFADSCAKYIVKHDCGFEQGSWILRKLTRMGHVNLDLIDYLGEKIVNDPETGKTCRPTSFISFVSAMANADYKPPGWDCIQHILLKNDILQEKEHHMTLPWVRLAIDLAVLDVYSSELLHRIFNEEFLSQFLSREYNKLDQLQLLLLYQAVMTLNPSYSGPLPPMEVIERVMKMNGDHVDEFPLQAALERGLGGPSYVYTKLLTKLGHFIDHLVVMRKGGYPVALNQIIHDFSFKAVVEDITVPSDAQIILVLCLTENSYNINCKRLRSVHTLTLRTLEALGHTIVPVSLPLWTSLPEFEKIPYLMQNIKVKCDSLDSEAGVVF